MLIERGLGFTQGSFRAANNEIHAPPDFSNFLIEEPVRPCWLAGEASLELFERRL
jgi:hypothetical protein